MSAANSSLNLILNSVFDVPRHHNARQIVLAPLPADVYQINRGGMQQDQPGIDLSTSPQPVSIQCDTFSYHFDLTFARLRDVVGQHAQVKEAMVKDQEMNGVDFDVTRSAICFYSEDNILVDLRRCTAYRQRYGLLLFCTNDGIKTLSFHRPWAFEMTTLRASLAIGLTVSSYTNAHLPYEEARFVSMGLHVISLIVAGKSTFAISCSRDSDIIKDDELDPWSMMGGDHDGYVDGIFVFYSIASSIFATCTGGQPTTIFREVLLNNHVYISSLYYGVWWGLTNRPADVVSEASTFAAISLTLGSIPVMLFAPNFLEIALTAVTLSSLLAHRLATRAGEPMKKLYAGSLEYLAMLALVVFFIQGSNGSYYEERSLCRRAKSLAGVHRRLARW